MRNMYNMYNLLDTTSLGLKDANMANEDNYQTKSVLEEAPGFRNDHIY